VARTVELGPVGLVCRRVDDLKCARGGGGGGAGDADAGDGRFEVRFHFAKARRVASAATEGDVEGVAGHFCVVSLVFVWNESLFVSKKKDCQ